MKTILNFLILSMVGCAAHAQKPAVPEQKEKSSPPFASRYTPGESKALIIRNATVLTGTGDRLEKSDIYIKDGRILAIGPGLPALEGVEWWNAEGLWVTPGIIDVHSHLGVYPAPDTLATADGNEMTDPVTPQVWAEHSIWPQDPQFPKALAGGVTSMLILPGSANLIGGRGVVIKNIPKRTVQEMKFPGAPYSLKMACGENPKRVYGGRNQFPSTRMGNIAGYRNAWIRATRYRKAMDKYEEKKKSDKEANPPDRDLALETLADVLRGNILVQNHCYRADEMAQMIDIAKEFGYHISAFHHAVESYKVADLLAKEKICSAMWADWWGFKMESYDGIRENVAMVDRAGACAVVHSDSAEGIQRLNQEAAKAMAAGNRVGMKIGPERAVMWITLNAAKAIGIDKETGSLEKGKMADLVIWNRNPFSFYALAEKVLIDGALMYDRSHPENNPVTDFELGRKSE